MVVMKKIYTINNVSQIARDVKIAVASDFYFQSEKDFKRLCVLFGKLFRERPDYIVLLGNLVSNANIGSKELNILEKYFFELSKIAKVYSILDNHDVISYIDGYDEPFINQELIEALQKRITLIGNKIATLNEGITLFGNLIDLENRKKLTHDTFNILLENTTDCRIYQTLASSHQLDLLDLVLYSKENHEPFVYLDTINLTDKRVSISSHKKITQRNLTWMNRFTSVPEEFVILQKKKSR